MSNCVGQPSTANLASPGPDLCRAEAQDGESLGVEGGHEGGDQAKAFLALLEQANSVIVDGQILVNWHMDAVIGDPGNEVVCFKWIDEEFLEFSVKLTEEGIAAGAWVGDWFYCKDGEGDDVQITLLRHVAIVPAQSEVPA